MQSNGSLTTAKAAATTPMNIIESGPAAGVVGVQAMACQIGIDKAISFDMGGTTAKASIIENDLAEVGAGGGSLIRIDAGGALQIGPQSAGAAPGPVCYDRGGTEPTLTDANVVLGYMNPDHLVGGAVKLDAGKARSVIETRIAQALGMSTAEAAWGAYLIAASNMIRAIKAVSSERGRDPREYALVAFGGNGPLFAVAMAQALQIRRVLIPPSAGVFSSYGLLYSEVAYHFTRSRKALLGAVDPAEIDAILRELETHARTALTEDGFTQEQIALERAAALHYQGQSFELEVPVPPGAIDRATLAALEEAYGVEHEKTYGHRAGADEPVELITLKVVGRGVPEIPRAALAATARLPEDVVIAQPLRHAYFGPARGWCDTAIINRSDLREPRAGPCIIEEYDSTCVVPPGSTANLDPFGNIVIDVRATPP
jgi:N-methylhydantoinase A